MRQADQMDQMLRQLQRALEAEKKEDIERHRAIIEEHSLVERRKKGWTWHPVTPIDYGYTFGDKAYVELERTKDLGAAHKFRSGQPVRIYVEEEEDGREVSGVLHYVRDNQMKVVLYDEDYPDWIMGHSLAVEQLFDARTYKAMERAIRDAADARGRYRFLLDRLLTDKSPDVQDVRESIKGTHLNPSQVQAVSAMKSFDDILVLHGPPGTGKTTTLVEGILEMVRQGNKILVTAASNTAVDVLTERLGATRSINVLRLGNISRVNDEILDLTIEGKLAKQSESKKIKQLKIEAAALRDKAGKYKRQFGREEREERKDLYREAREVQRWANQLERRLIDRLVDEAQVICATLINSDHKLLRDIDFDCTVVDEAGQGLDPALFIPLSRSQRWIMAGDPYQLPPTVKSREAQELGLSTNMLERWVTAGKPSFFLDTQYRMHADIMWFSNAYFYNERLRAAPEVAQKTLAIQQSAPVEFIDTAGCDFEEKINEENLSRYNEGEAFILREHFLQLRKDFEESKVPFPKIGIITPYREQVRHIRKLIAEDAEWSAHESYIKVDSIDGFQGNEKTVIYISLVRSNATGEIGFLTDYRRMNVALTRAREKLIVIGDSATLGQDPFYRKWLERVETEALYRSAWEFMAT
jgi:superfamily I DNA and/or RNA helicase